MALTIASLLRITVVVVIAVIFVTACFTLPIEKILKSFLVWIDRSLGKWGPLVLALAYVPLTVLAVPASILTLGGGYLYGLPIGFIADSIGSTAGATAAYFVGKMVGRSYVLSKLKDRPQFEAIVIATQRSGFKIVFLLRLAPLLPFNILNYLFSLTPIGVWEYVVASWLGMMPITFALVYVGTTIKDLSDVTHGWKEVSLSNWIFLSISIIATVVLMILVTRVAKNSLNEALNNEGDASEGVPVLTLHKPLLVKTDDAFVPVINVERA
eukprot:TRINITY_DN6071_c0_g1_i1.p1 TRINITY_DN6071_c0_g1~~TRINITY_DN6071_c0_g1_i1.p1  ORF type:complete len:269 (+),score=30.12 TRINITY_DN6071_c0_g1_i1:325-1131(+)